MGLTNPDTLSKVQEIIDALYNANAICDNIVNLLDVKFNMPNSSDLFHHRIAHAFPNLADSLSDYMQLRRDRVYRGAIPIHREEFEYDFECYQFLYDYLISLENMIKSAIDIAIDDDNKEIEDKLRDFLKDNIVLYTKQLQILKDIAIKYNHLRSPTLDSDIDDYYTVITELQNK